MNTIDSTYQVSDSTKSNPQAAGPDLDIVKGLKELIQLNKSADTSSSATLDNLNTDMLYTKSAAQALPTSSAANSSDQGATTGPATQADAGAIAAPAKPAEAGSVTSVAKQAETGKTTEKAIAAVTGKATEKAIAVVTGKATDGHSKVAKPGDKAGSEAQTAVQKEDQKLSDWADKNLQEPQKTQFNDDLKEFEERAKQDGLSQDEVLKTYQQIERLTGATGDKPLSQADRNQLAYEVLHQAAEPTAISQGKYNTCNVASVETRTYTRTPSDAAKLVADVALTGQYRAADGTKVTIDPTAHDQSTIWPPQDDVRTHASEIFQVTAVNLYYAQQNAKTGSDIKYLQVDPTPGDYGDDGERLLDYSKNPPQLVPPTVPTDSTDSSFPNLTDADIVDISDAITGKKESIVLLSAQDQPGSGLTEVRSEAQLKQILAKLKADHQLPVIVLVDVNNEPFYTDSGAGPAGGDTTGGAHVVTITDYDPATGAVDVQNQWSPSDDHGVKLPTPDPNDFSPVDRGALSVHDLYIAMQTPANAQKILQQDVANSQANGLTNPEEEADLLRRQNGVNESQTMKSLEQIIDEMAKNPSANHSSYTLADLVDVIDKLSPEDQIKVDQLEYQDKLITATQLRSALDTADQAAKTAYDQTHRILGINVGAFIDYHKELSNSKKVRASLPPDTQGPMPVVQGF